MKIILTADNDDGKQELVITNEGYDNLNYLSLQFGDKEYGVVLDELAAAVNAFREDVKFSHERDERYR